MSPPQGGIAKTKERPNRWFKVRVVIAACILVFGFGYYLVWRNGLPPRVVSEIASGTVFLDVPLLALYTPSLQVANYSTLANVSIVDVFGSPATRWTFTWASMDGSPLPAQFVLVPPSSNETGPSEFSPGPGNGFLVHSEGEHSPGSSGVTFAIDRPGANAAFSEVWRMDFVVRAMTAHDWFGEHTWNEVDYSLESVSALIDYMPVSNSTPPLPSDLRAFGTPFGIEYGAGIPWSLEFSIREAPLPASGFSRSFGPVSLDAGTLGVLSLGLSVGFQWGPHDGNVVLLSGSGPASLRLQPYLDMRYGSLYLVPIA